MFEGIAVALGGGRDKIFCAVFVGDIEGVKSSERSDFQRRDAVDGVIDRAGGAGEVKDVIDSADVEGFANVFIYEFEPGFISEMVKVCLASGEQIVDDDDAVALAEQGIAEMGSEETGAAGDQSALLTHAFLVPFLRPFLSAAAGTPSGWEAARPTE